MQTSSVVAFGPQDGDVLNEESPSRADGHWINYFRTKYLADQEVAAGMGRGLNAVFVVPGYVVGPYELSHFSLMFKMLKQGKLPGAFPGAGPWCHVDTVVDALIKAAEVGTPGERFLIGAAHAKIADVLGTVADRLGVKAPKPFPAWFLKPVAKMAEWGSFITGKEPEITPEVAHMFCMDVTFDCTKAETQLGCYETSIEKMVDDMHAWLLAEGRL